MRLRAVGFFFLFLPLCALHCRSAPAPDELLPCDVSTVLEASCQSCHGNPTSSGAPMALVTFADLHAPAPSDPSRRVYQRVGARIHAATRPMPPPPYPLLDGVDLLTLDHWTAADAPPARDGFDCTNLPPGPGNGGGGPSCQPCN